MHTIIHPTNATLATRRVTDNPVHPGFRTPHYECVEHADMIKLVMYVPGVDASGVEITQRGPDLIVTAQKSHFVRVNWQALHLEGAQRDYQLRLRLGHAIDFDDLKAELVGGVLTLTIPKVGTASVTTRHRHVA
jgi:HSP20 family protein